MSEATPRPWRVGGRWKARHCAAPITAGIRPVIGKTIAYVGPNRTVKRPEVIAEDLENAKLIVRAVNNHDALLDVAKAVVEQFPLAGISSNLGSHNPLEDLLARAEAAIAAAEATE